MYANLLCFHPSCLTRGSPLHEFRSPKVSLYKLLVQLDTASCASARTPIHELILMTDPGPDPVEGRTHDNSTSCSRAGLLWRIGYGGIEYCVCAHSEVSLCDIQTVHRPSAPLSLQLYLWPGLHKRSQPAIELDPCLHLRSERSRHRGVNPVPPQRDCRQVELRPRSVRRAEQ